MLFIGLNIFNEADFIAPCLTELYPFAVRIVIAAGAYRYFPDHGLTGAGEASGVTIYGALLNRQLSEVRKR